jgi:hypothetical protein
MKISISKRLLGLQNVQRVELSAILETLEETKDRNNLHVHLCSKAQKKK